MSPSLVSLQLDKLLVYEERSVSRKHPENTDKENGMFAKLLVQLPSSFPGATFALTLSDGKTLKQTMDVYETRFIAHYANCEHDILPIQSGYLLVLEYSLCYTLRDIAKPYGKGVAKGHFVSLLRRLPKSKTVFIVPCRWMINRLLVPKK